MVYIIQRRKARAYGHLVTYYELRRYPDVRSYQKRLYGETVKEFDTKREAVQHCVNNNIVFEYCI